ncbi:MAG: hydroxymethylpyrimidine/phosphomethylpyrimidine kinase [Deltaproteobacteria bacterium]|nr:hydroxymethylpyrimidine/phosphomethylpyrimidine kinase [Deltaproteobacteria bacterium]
MRQQPTLLSIAGSDPSGGAGVQRDLTVFHDLKFRPLSVITALTAQNEKSFFSLNPVSPEILEDQLLAVETQKISGIKIGMLGTAAIVEKLVSWLKNWNGSTGSPCPDRSKMDTLSLSKGEIPIVLDTIFHSTTGGILLDDEGIALLQESLMPLATVVTPNLSEASRLINHPVTNLKEMKKAGEMILWSMKRGAEEEKEQAVLIKGGHLDGAPTDLLFDGKKFVTIKGKRLPGSLHGSGCLLSSALTANLASGFSFEESARRARRYLNRFFSCTPSSSGL